MLHILKKHKEAIAWSIEELKGISPSICMHKILLEETSRPTVEHQRILRKEFRAGEKVLLFNSRLRLFPGKLKSKWGGPYTVVSSNTFGTVTLRSDTGEEFRVNGQRLKHYLSREEGMEELQQVIWIEEESEQQVQLRTQSGAADGRQPIRNLNS